MIDDPQQSALTLVDLSLQTPEENLALDEALLNQAEQTENFSGLLRFWESSLRFVVLGSVGRLSEEVHVEACRSEKIPVLRRSSGGGTVLAGPGCLFFSLILNLDERPDLRDIHGSYREILGRLVECLGVDGLAHRGISDLALHGRKVSGNAQRRKSHTLLHHGTILYAFDLDAMAMFLKDPERQPKYREKRPHAVFTANLLLSVEEIKSRISRCWQARVSEQKNVPDLTKLIQEKYGNPGWTQRF